MAKIFVKDVQPEDVLGEDVYKGNALALKKGKVLTKGWLNKLHQWGIEKVEIHRENETSEDEEQLNEQELKYQFFDNVIGLGNEYRFGFALNDLERYKWLEELFCSIMNESNVKALLDRIKNWDLYTYQHSFDVFILGALLASECDFPNIREFAIGCLLHDVGKLEVPQEILRKKGALNGKEMEAIQTHPADGYDLLKELQFSENVALLARNHHERLNGKGYPDGIPGGDIQEPARLLSVVDVYSALSLDRPYRKAVYPHKAIRIILLEESVDIKYVASLCETLEIFPLGATVELTDKRIAKIVKVDDKLPTFPLLKEEHSSKVFYVPTNRTVRIRRMLLKKQTED